MLSLISMTEDEFQLYKEFSIQDYAQEQVRRGHWYKADARQKAEQQYQQLLPQGLQTPKQYLWMVLDEELGQNVGIIWCAMGEEEDEQRAFVYDVRVFEEFRRKGYLSLTSHLLARQAAELGATAVSVHIFEHNLAGREMYEKLGYVVTDTLIVKKIAKHPAASEEARVHKAEE
jgi:GNAT superfamily N-acetyltransferase